MCNNVLQSYLLKVKGFSSEDAGACDYLSSVFMNIAIKTKLTFFFLFTCPINLALLFITKRRPILVFKSDQFDTYEMIYRKSSTSKSDVQCTIKL